DKAAVFKKSSLSTSNPMQGAKFKSSDHYNSQSCIDNAISKIKSFEDGGSKAADITNALLFMVTKDNMPLNTINKEDCQYLLKLVAPLYKIPGRQQFTDLIDKKIRALVCKKFHTFVTSNPMQGAKFKSSDHYNSQSCIDNAISKIKSFEDGGSKAADITNALLFMVTKDNMPLNTINKEDCQYLLKLVAPLYKIPGRQQFTDLIDKKIRGLVTFNQAKT
ncbi:uncharacterized protein, partial [Mycetomoellerius zeteki]|uniref:uncharacterized protein n=1 Tax=Mycetomoellerius zeteki TaxID=64791 RepID=UPI00084EA758